MRPTPIPDDEVYEGARRIVVGPPGGDLTSTDIAPVEALIAPCGGRFSVRCVLEPGDIDKLDQGGAVWLTMYSRQLVPFSLDVAERGAHPHEGSD